LNDTFDYITRFVIVVFGYCCALLAAGWFLAAILFRTLGIDSFMNDFVMMASDTDAGSFFAATSFWSAVFVGGFALAMLAGGFSFVPALVLIILAEARGYRSSLYYCVAGTLIGLAAASASLPFSDTRSVSESSLWIAAIAGAGVVGSFVYWLLAGRNAGRLLSRPAE
jgi:signal transduction histidine kinase